jgi:hypothetical protein
MGDLARLLPFYQPEGSQKSRARLMAAPAS